MKHVFFLEVVFMSMLMLSACGSDEKNQNIDSDQSSDVELSTDESVVTEDELVDNGDTDADEIPDEDLVAKYGMLYVDGKLSFSLPAGEWCYVSCRTVAIAEVYYEGNIVGVVEYDGGSGPECDVVSSQTGWERKFSITLDPPYPTIEVKMLWGCSYWDSQCSLCEGKEAVTVTLTNQ